MQTMANSFFQLVLDSVVKPLFTKLNVTVLPKLVSGELFGRQYEVRNGTFDPVDYDDAWMLALAYHSSVIFDLGANIGQSTFLMLQAPNVKNVVLVDASPLALTIAADNLIRNHLSDRVRFYNAFVSDTVGESVRFATPGGSATGGHYVQADDSGVNPNDIATVPTITIDRLVEMFTLTPDLVKIDIVDYEKQVMDGGSKLAEQAKTRFLIEMHRTERKTQRQNTQDILDWCARVNYAAWYLKEAVRLSSPDTVEHRGRYHLLLQPAAWEFPAELAQIPQNAEIEIVPPLFSN